MNEGISRQKAAKKRSLYEINEHFELLFNAERPSVIDFRLLLGVLYAG